MSYIAFLTAKSGWLLGGVKTVQSSRMETRQMAEDLLWVWIDTNRKAGVDVGEGEIGESNWKPEIWEKDVS